MKIRKVVAVSTLALGSLLAATQPSAQSFVGGSLGQSDISDDITGGLITSGTVDGKHTAFKIFGGYMFNRHLGIESAYVRLGDVTYSGRFEAQPVTGGVVEASGLSIALLGRYPLTQELSLLGKLGLFLWEWKARDTTSGQPFSTTEGGSDLSFGAGLSYDFTRNWAVRAEWERFKLDDTNADLVSVGVLWRF